MTEDEILFFAGKPGAAALYEALAAKIREQVDDVRVQVRKSQISFLNRRMFACASLLPARRKAERPEPYLTVTFGLDRRVDSPRIAVAVEPYPRRWNHHVLIGTTEEIDEELLSWIREAAVFAALK